MLELTQFIQPPFEFIVQLYDVLGNEILSILHVKPRRIPRCIKDQSIGPQWHDAHELYNFVDLYTFRCLNDHLVMDLMGTGTR